MTILKSFLDTIQPVNREAIARFRFQLSETGEFAVPVSSSYRTTEASAVAWLFKREAWYLELGLAVHWTWPEKRFVVTLNSATVADVWIEEVSA